MDVSFFRSHMLTKGLSGSQIKELTSLLSEVSLEAGEALFKEGTTARGLFIVSEGKVRVTKSDPAGDERELVELDAPTVLGELELISGNSSFASASAVTAVRGYVLERDAFEKLVNEGHPVATKITRNIARVVIQRLIDTNARVVALVALMHS